MGSAIKDGFHSATADHVDAVSRYFNRDACLYGSLTGNALLVSSHQNITNDYLVDTSGVYLGFVNDVLNHLGGHIGRRNAAEASHKLADSGTLSSNDKYFTHNVSSVLV